MHRIVCLLLALMLLVPACAEEKYSAFPSALRMTQKRVKASVTKTTYTMAHYPKTNNKTVNQELEGLIDQLTAENLPYLPSKSALSDEDAFVDTGVTVYRTGDKWASFLLSSSVVDGTKQLKMTFDTRAYDMQTGTPLTLTDVLLPGAYEVVRGKVYSQLAAYFPQYETDEEKLRQLCSESSIQSASFTLSPAFLQLHFPSEALYEHEGIVMHVRIPYTLLSDYLTEEAKVQTDNSRYKLVALTYDDGPTRKRTLAILRTLRSGGINATFFVVGERMAAANDLIALEHNAGFAIASHNYYHVYPSKMQGKVQLYRDMLNEELCTITGKPVSMMRAPGGHEEIYIEENVGLPLIHWSIASKDANSSDFDPKKEALRLGYGANDGSIILMHDLRRITADYTEYLPQLLNDQGFLCVTVEELFALRGIPLQPNTVYNSARPQ